MKTGAVELARFFEKQQSNVGSWTKELAIMRVKRSCVRERKSHEQEEE